MPCASWTTRSPGLRSVKAAMAAPRWKTGRRSRRRRAPKTSSSARRTSPRAGSWKPAAQSPVMTPRPSALQRVASGHGSRSCSWRMPRQRAACASSSTTRRTTNPSPRQLRISAARSLKRPWKPPTERVPMATRGTRPPPRWRSGSSSRGKRPSAWARGTAEGASSGGASRQREHRQLAERLHGPLRGRIEEPQRVDLVAEELRARGPIVGGREDVDDPAPQAPLSHLDHGLHPLVAGRLERPEKSLALQARSHRQREGPGAKGFRGENRRTEGGRRGDHHVGAPGHEGAANQGSLGDMVAMAAMPGAGLGGRKLQNGDARGIERVPEEAEGLGGAVTLGGARGEVEDGPAGVADEGRDHEGARRAPQPLGFETGYSLGEGRGELSKGGPPGQYRLRRGQAHERTLRDTTRQLSTRPSRGRSLRLGTLRQVETQGLQLDGQIHALEPHVLGSANAPRGEVEDGLDPGGHELFRHRLGRFGRHRHDGDLEIAALGLAREVAHGQDGHAVGQLPRLGGIVVEDGRDPEALAGEALVVEERRAQVTEAHQRHLPLAIQAQDALELGLEARDVVADAAHAELAEVGEVLPDLGGVQTEALGQLLGRDGLDSVLFELQETARVHGQAPDRHLRDAGNLELGPSSHFRAASDVPGTWPRDARDSCSRYDFTNSKMTAMTKTKRTSDSMKARPSSMAVWMRAMAPGWRAMASTAEPAARPWPSPQRPAARPKPMPAARTAKAFGRSPAAVSAAQAIPGAARIAIRVNVTVRRTALLLVMVVTA